MCGICGIHVQTDDAPIDPNVLVGMLDHIYHRGPDDDGVYLEPGLALGMRRLSIIDLVGGKQPITNEDGRIVVVFNGEIYNYQELTKELVARGHRFTTSSDTEVIVHLYEELGEECLHQLRGMFSFAVWDKGTRRLFIARDRLGIKPLYYTEIGHQLVFASEIKAILQHPAVKVTPSLPAISNFLSLKYVPSPQTMFAGIKSLPPGYCLTSDKNGTRVRQYWDLSYREGEKAKGSEEEYAKRLDDLLRESVRLELRSDVPFGAFLSGGVDSSLIVALMSEYLDEPVKTFSVGFEGDAESFSELPYARLAAQRYGTDHHEVIVRPEDFIDLAEKVAWHLDQPIADEACLAIYMLSDLASKQVKMVLTGEGGDELFAGYARYAGEKLSGLFRSIPAPAKSLMLGGVGRMPGLRRPKMALYALCQSDEVRRITNWFPLLNEDMKASLLSSEMVGRLDGALRCEVFGEHLARTDARTPLNRMLYVDTKLWLADALLARGDKITMASSLEARVPFLDHKLVEFAASLPPKLKLNGLMRKYLLKKVARGYLPTQIIDRQKKGFPMPTSVWYRKQARSFVRDTLSPATIKQRGLFNPAAVEKLLNDHEAELADHAAIIWGLLGLELWFRLFSDRSARRDNDRVRSC